MSVQTTSILVNIRVQVQAAPAKTGITVRINVLPAVPVFATDEYLVPASLTISPIPVPITGGMIGLLQDKLAQKVANYYDEDRATKTLLNFGNDYQALITNWQFDPRDTTQTTLNVKLYEPLPAGIETKRTLWISRELAPTLIDRVHAIYVPDAPELVYLRPPNKNIDVAGRSGYGISNVTTQTLFSSSLFDVVKPTDPVLEEWFTFDINSSELNVDYSDYRNFVFFSSAAQRLLAFQQKMSELENLSSILVLHSASLYGTGSANITGSAAYAAIQSLAEQRIDTLRSFDGYERFLYYKTGIPYSASLTTSDYQDEIYFNDDATWPKTNGANVSVSSAASWLGDQLAIAYEYDRYNQDRLATNIPQYLQEDEGSTEFLTFLDMIGHQVDVLKLYIDQMSNIYDRDSDALTGLSQDLTWDIAESFGITLPNQYAIKKLVDYTIGETQSNNPTVYRTVAAETWKRFLHNQIFLMKTKGTKTSLRALTNTYGILPTTLQIRESVTPGFSYLTGSYEIYEEQTNALSFNQGAFVTLPWATGSLTPQTLEIRFATTTAGTLATAATWGLVATAYTGSYGRIELRNASNATIATSGYVALFSGDYYTVALRNDTTGVTMIVERADQDEIVDFSTVQAASGSINWFTPTNWYLGGSGSQYGGADWTGTVDEVRVWGESLSNATIDLHVRYPGMYNGNTPSSATTALYSRLSFNIARNLGVVSSVPNESPLARVNGASYIQSFPVYGFTNIPEQPYNMVVNTREVQRFAPNAGGSQFTTNKVTIADPPTLQYMTFASSSAQVPVLSRTTSMNSVASKESNPKSINTVGFYFSLTDAINDSIIRSIGNIDLQDLIGDPRDQFKHTYKDLSVLSQLYWNSYAYTYSESVFIDFVKTLLDPLFKQARSLIPVRAKLLGGIVHEPHILERSKAAMRPVQFYAGTYARYPNQSVNLEAAYVDNTVSPMGDITRFKALISASQTIQPHASYITHEGVVDTTDILTPQATYDSKLGTVSLDDILQPIAVMSAYEGVVGSTTVVDVKGNMPAYNDYTNALNMKRALLLSYGVTSELQLSGAQLAQFQQEWLAGQDANVINVQSGLNAAKQSISATLPTGTNITTQILPYTNFNAIESYTYFTDPLGYVGVTGYVQVRRKAGSLNARGAWANGATYARNDFVTLTNALGTVTEWTCTTTDTTFVSVLSPDVDYNNWSVMQYVPQETTFIKKAILLNGVVSLAPTSSAYPPVIGYQPSHYRFTRDTRTGTLRHLWLGCVQTDDTTPNGRPAVEIFASAGDVLVVNNPGEPIQQKSNIQGPILDIQ